MPTLYVVMGEEPDGTKSMHSIFHTKEALDAFVASNPQFWNDAHQIDYDESGRIAKDTYMNYDHLDPQKVAKEQGQQKSYAALYANTL